MYDDNDGDTNIVAILVIIMIMSTDIIMEQLQNTLAQPSHDKLHYTVHSFLWNHMHKCTEKILIPSRGILIILQSSHIK